MCGLFTAMKELASKLTKAEQICLFLVLLISVSLFVHYSLLNSRVSLNDENGYYRLRLYLKSGRFESPVTCPHERVHPLS